MHAPSRHSQLWALQQVHLWQGAGQICQSAPIMQFCNHKFQFTETKLRMKFNSLLKFAPWFVCICCLGISNTSYEQFFFPKDTLEWRAGEKVDWRGCSVRVLFAPSFRWKLGRVQLRPSYMSLHWHTAARLQNVFYPYVLATQIFHWCLLLTFFSH